MEQVFVGIDVAKDRLDVHVRPSGAADSVARDGKGLEDLVARLRTLDVALIVLEATGGFETTVAGALCAAGLPLAVVNPRQIRDFAWATGRLAKTDALDASVIAHFAEAIRPEARPVPDKQARALGELVTRRRQIVDMMAVERGRRKRLANRRMIKSVDRLLKALKRDHPSLSLSRQCRLLSLGRSSLYYEPKGESAETLALMQRIDELFQKYPFYGARRMALHLRRGGVRIGRRRAARLMRLMGFRRSIERRLSK